MRVLLAFLLWLPMLLPGAAVGAEPIPDATGRLVQVPENVARVLPAGPPAAVLLAALAPDLMLGWPHTPSTAALALLDPRLAKLPAVPHLGADSDAAVTALRPDLIVDYGTVSPSYIDQARGEQERTGIATVLFNGQLSDMPRVLRVLGGALHRQARAEDLAKLAEALLAAPATPRRTVIYLRGADELKAVAPGTGASEVFAHLGWHVLTTPGQGTFHPATLAGIAALDPDVVLFGDPAMRGIVAVSPDWRALRAVRDGHAYTVPRQPFGWIEEPPSLNQLLGFAWLSGSEPATLAKQFYALVYGHVLTTAELQVIAESAAPLPP